MLKLWELCSRLAGLFAVNIPGSGSRHHRGVTLCCFCFFFLLLLLLSLPQGNHIYTSGATGTNAAVIKGALRAENKDLLTVILPQSLSRQPAESQELLSQVSRCPLSVSW